MTDLRYKIHQFFIDNNIKMDYNYDSENEENQVILKTTNKNGYEEVVSKYNLNDSKLELCDDRIEMLERFLQDNNMRLETDYDGNKGTEYIAIMDTMNHHIIKKIDWNFG